ncbi:hypothetical protein HYFRA_00010734 [Hymenoscyphus fraxineus]|uniref:Rhodopsin domain-containing protein n=1 Tax=Hymenoscyphus fraxineus TaxID=746836 RepID=A0A9N9L063_9HELO|nr:hypothetical protein HYFRA_00010734 [Hymenoscyphus fraxineus]
MNSTYPGLRPTGQRSIAPRAFLNLLLTFIFTSLALIFLVLRLVARFILTKTGGKDELIIIVAFIFAVGLIPATLHQADHGLGIPTSQLNLADIREILKGLYAAIICYIMALWLAKLAIGLQYLRVFKTGKTRIVVWLAIFLTVAYGIEAMVLAVFTCKPINSFWNVELDGECIDLKVGYVTNASYQIVSDLIFLAIPMPLLSKVNIPMEKRLWALSALGIGIVGCLMSILRLHGLYELGISDDLAFENAYLSMWSNLEVLVAILCACSQTFQPIIRSAFPNLLPETESLKSQPFYREPLPIYQPTQIPNNATSGSNTIVFFSGMNLEVVDRDKKVVFDKENLI